MVMPAIVPSTDVPEIDIRPATPADLPALLELLLHNGSADFSDVTIEEVMTTLPTVFVVERSGFVLGCAALVIYNAKIAEITWLALSPMSAEMEWSVGRALIDACVELARERHIYEVMLISEAEEFMTACGFHESLKRQKRAYFYQDAPTQAVIPFPVGSVDKQPQDKL